MSRAYHSPLRTKQVEQTRELLLEAVLAMASDDVPAEITIASVAARAGVAIRTAYRYFATKEELIDAFNAWAHKRAGFPEISDDADQLPRDVEKLFRAYERDLPIMRAARRMAPEIKRARRAEQVRMFMRAIGPRAARLDPVSARAAIGAIHTLAASDTYFNLTENWGATGADAGRAARWAMQVLLREIEAGRGPEPSMGADRSDDSRSDSSRSEDGRKDGGRKDARNDSRSSPR
jgi:AcrR family transcriptional regulator